MKTYLIIIIRWTNLCGHGHHHSHHSRRIKSLKYRRQAWANNNNSPFQSRHNQPAIDNWEGVTGGRWLIKDEGGWCDGDHLYHCQRLEQAGENTLAELPTCRAASLAGHPCQHQACLFSPHPTFDHAQLAKEKIEVWFLCCAQRLTWKGKAVKSGRQCNLKRWRVSVRTIIVFSSDRSSYSDSGLLYI